eukprot:CAMPEP_0115679318 /NCGR_PEP_ID=MMETSP0272-20121206/56217_1 /TAXON_ID=71861 /ORGANISM="Scrippsiella trochoidea, Strain CCMP3099" /LENGTH=146 /DNA_ID=CAMNT_0003118539 /DNA_START=29 /DNA_END=466 /DNA_ORIENTATION=+
MTVPSCMPLASSSSMPIHSPEANFTPPMKRTVPWLPAHMTRCPSEIEPSAVAGAEGSVSAAASSEAEAEAVGDAPPTESCAACAKAPRFGAQTKYGTPMTLPSCMPPGSASSSPTHSPLANLTSPMYRTVPRLPLHETACPSAMEP